MPRNVVDRIIYALKIQKKAMNGTKVLFIGLAYKLEVDDMWESPTLKLFDLLEKKVLKYHIMILLFLLL